MAIEGVYFVYVALSAALVFINIAVERLYKERRYKAVTRAGHRGSGGVPSHLSDTIAFYAARYGV